MTKRIVSLSIDIEVIELAKQKIPNISAFVNNLLKIETSLVDMKKEDELNQLKLSNTKLISEIEDLRKKLEDKEEKKKESKLNRMHGVDKYPSYQGDN